MRSNEQRVTLDERSKNTDRQKEILYQTFNF